MRRSYRRDGKGNIIEQVQPEPRLVSGASIYMLQDGSSGNGGVSWSFLRDAMLCIAPQDEVV
jgi:hypothetical protein